MFNRREMMQASAIGLSGLFVPTSVETTLPPIKTTESSDVISTGFPIIDQYLKGGLRKGTFVVFEHKWNPTDTKIRVGVHEIIEQIKKNNPNDVVEENLYLPSASRFDKTLFLEHLNKIRKACQENKVLFGIRIGTTTDCVKNRLASVILSVHENKDNDFTIRISKNRYGKSKVVSCVSSLENNTAISLPSDQRKLNLYNEKTYLDVCFKKPEILERNRSYLLAMHETNFCISSVGEAFDFLTNKFPDACEFEISSKSNEPESFGWVKIDGTWHEKINGEINE